MVEPACLCLELPFKKNSISVNLHLLYVLLIQLHFVVLKGGRKGAPPPPQELARSLTDARNSCVGSTEGTVGLGPGNGLLNRE